MTMKKILMNLAGKSLIAAIVLAAATGCNDAELRPIDNAAYIAEAYKATSTMLSFSNDESAQTTLTARLGDRAASDVTFRFEVSPEVLNRYNELNGTSYVLLPETAYTLSKDPVVIGVGEASASPLQVEILPYSEEMKESGVTYALPVKLYSADGRMQVLGDNSEFLIICNWMRIVPAPIFNAEYESTFDSQKLNRVMFDMGEEAITFQAYTFEFLMYMDEFASVDNMMIVGLDGQEGGLTNRMWVRFELNGGDPINRWMQLNTMVKPAVYATTPNQAKTWQHVAITFDGTTTRLYLDGSQVGEKVAPNPTIKFRYFSLLPQPVSFKRSVSFREVRLWNVARTASQLANNATNVDPNSNGLLGYWKMDEGQGYTFNDATGNGHTGMCEYSNAGDISIPWNDTNYGPATGLKWVENSEHMDE